MYYKMNSVERKYGKVHKCDFSNKRIKLTPDKHQQRVVEYILNTDHRGILLFHDLGSGKTLSSILSADALVKKTKNPVWILTPGSLAENFITSYCTHAEDPENLETNFKFFSYNDTTLLNMNKLPSNFNNSIIIVDEAHNIIRGYQNKSPTPMAIYNLI